MEKYEGNTKWSISKSCPSESKIHALSHNTKLLDLYHHFLAPGFGAH